MATPDRYSWTSSRVEEVDDGIFRIPLPLPQDGLRAVNVYAIVGEDRITLIDSGWAVPASRVALEDGLAAIDKTLGDISQFLVTHLHPDHYAQASVLRAELAAPISLGEEEKSNLESVLRIIATGGRSSNRRGILIRADAGEVLDLLPPPRVAAADVERQWRQPDVWLPADTEVEAEHRRLTVVHTPGHTRGHVVFHDEDNRLLFAGDHILPQITPSIGLEAVASPWPLRDYLDSLRLMKTRPDAKLLPAHGPVWESAHLRVDQLIAHHEERLAQALRAVESGASTGYEVAKALRWTYHGLALGELDLANQAMAIGETVAHLDVLVLYGSLSTKSDERGVDIYTTP